MVLFQKSECYTNKFDDGLVIHIRSEVEIYKSIIKEKV